MIQCAPCMLCVLCAGSCENITASLATAHAPQSCCAYAVGVCGVLAKSIFTTHFRVPFLLSTTEKERKRDKKAPTTADSGACNLRRIQLADPWWRRATRHQCPFKHCKQAKRSEPMLPPRRLAHVLFSIKFTATEMQPPCITNPALLHGTRICVFKKMTSFGEMINHFVNHHNLIYLLYLPIDPCTVAVPLPSTPSYTHTFEYSIHGFKRTSLMYLLTTLLSHYKHAVSTPCQCFALYSHFKLHGLTSPARVAVVLGEDGDLFVTLYFGTGRGETFAHNHDAPALHSLQRACV